jgi:hypothetical protein
VLHLHNSRYAPDGNKGFPHSQPLIAKTNLKTFAIIRNAQQDYLVQAHDELYSRQERQGAKTPIRCYDIAIIIVIKTFLASWPLGALGENPVYACLNKAIFNNGKKVDSFNPDHHPS